MKCNIPKCSEKDFKKLQDELRKLRCSKCGAVIREYSSPFFMIYDYQNMNARICLKCKGGAE
jgi:NAD-dependent SIR2 family protein deacetylase